MVAATVHQQRRYVTTASARIAFVDQGIGPHARFVHGVPLNGCHGRRIVDRLAELRSCIVPDRPGTGCTEINSWQDVCRSAQARMIVECFDVPGICGPCRS